MFEKRLTALLSDNEKLIGLLSTYRNRPAIFSPVYPKLARYPFITYYTQSHTEHTIKETNDLIICVYTYGMSKNELDTIANCIMDTIDGYEMKQSRLGNLRFYLSRGPNLGFTEHTVKKVMDIRFIIRGSFSNWKVKHYELCS